MRITLNTGRNEERYQVLCGLAVDEYSRRRQNWSDMLDIEDDAQDPETRPVLMMPIMRNELADELPLFQSIFGAAVGDMQGILRADFS